MTVQGKAQSGNPCGLCLLWGDARAMAVDDAGAIHRVAPNTLSARLSLRGLEPTPMVLSRAMSNSE